MTTNEMGWFLRPFYGTIEAVIVMNKYEKALVLFDECSISAHDGIIRIIVDVPPGSTRYKDFEKTLASFLDGAEEITMRISPAQWEWRMDFRKVDCSNGATIQPYKPKNEISDEEFIKMFPPKIPLDTEKVDLLELLELADECNRSRKQFKMEAARSWNLLQKEMEIVKAGVAGTWEITEFDPADGTAFYSWELDTQDTDSSSQMVRVRGDALSALVSAIEIADGSTIGLTAREFSSLTEFLIGIDDPFS